MDWFLMLLAGTIGFFIGRWSATRNDWRKPG